MVLLLLTRLTRVRINLCRNWHIKRFSKTVMYTKIIKVCVFYYLICPFNKIENVYNVSESKPCILIIPGTLPHKIPQEVSKISKSVRRDF